MTSRLVKREQEVDEDEEDQHTFPFDEDPTKVEDPLAVKTDEDNDVNFTEAEMKTVKEEVDVGDVGRRQGSHKQSNENSGKLLKIIIKVEGESKGMRISQKDATPEEKRKQRESNRRKRAEKCKKVLRKPRERNRGKGAEEREERLRKQREKDRTKMARMKEEFEKIKTDAPAHQMLQDSQPSQYEKYLKRRREYQRRRRAENPEKHKEELKREREKRKRLKEENLEKYKEFRARANERRRKHGQPRPRQASSSSKIKKPRKNVTTEEKKERQRIRQRLWTHENRERVRFNKYSRLQMRIAQMTDEELATLKAKRREYAKNRKKLTGEKLKKYYERCLKSTTGEEYAYRDIINARYRHYVANETPEQRQRRLRRYKINQAITRLRKQLEEILVPQEEVERKVTELKRTMEAEPLPPLETLSKYKPRVKSEVNFERRRRGRPFGSFLKIDSSIEACCNSQGQPSMGSTEIDDSNDSQTQNVIRPNDMDESNDFGDDGFQCDSTFDEDADEQVKIDTNPNHGMTTTEPEPVSILRFDLKCPHCPSNYSERSDLINHISSKHSKICWKCPKCKIIVLNSDELREHFNTSHFQIPRGPTDAITSTSNNETSSKKENFFTCMKCDPVKSPHFKCVKDLMTHVKSTHPHSFWPCLNCNILKYTKCALKVHEKLCKFAGRTIKPNGHESVMRK